jgi:hypothetical protein
MSNDHNLERLRRAVIFAVCEPTDDQTDLDLLEQLHTDVISRAQFKWSQSMEETRECLRRKRKAIDDAHQRGMLFIGGVTASAMYLQNGQGTHLLTPEELGAMATRGADGNLVPLSGSYYHGCINNPTYFDYVRDYVHIIVDGGVDGLHFDEADSRWFHHVPYECFCDYCNEGLRRRLAARYSAKSLQSRYGIDDLSSFDYRRYLQEHGWAQCPGKSPLHGEWWRFQLEACRERYIALMDDSQAYAEQVLGRRLVNTANVYDPLWLPERFLESPFVEYVMIGSCLELRLRENGQPVQRMRLPPQYSYAPLHLATRNCTPDRPVTFFIDWPSGAEFMKAQPPEIQRNILKGLYAEAYACGVPFHTPYKSCYGMWTGPMDMLTQYASFYDRGRAHFGQVAPCASVGVLYSYASSIWDHFPSDLAPSPSEPIHAREYYGLCQALIDAAIPFGVLFAGDGQIMEKDLTREDLSRFEVIVAPCWYSVTESQVALLESFAQDGGKLIIVGPWAQIDAERQPLDSTGLRARMGRAGARFFESEDMAFEDYLAQVNPALRTKLVSSLEISVGHGLCASTGSASIEILLSRANDGSRLYIHIINRDFTGQHYVGKRNLPVSIPLPQGMRIDAQEARWISPDCAGVAMLPVANRGHQIAFTVPELEVYGLAILPLTADKP